jgi:hypothetical protein
MQDRYGWEYLQGIDLMGLERVPVFTHVISRARQEKKSFGLSGRQWTKLRKKNAWLMSAWMLDAKARQGEL